MKEQNKNRGFFFFGRSFYLNESFYISKQRLCKLAFPPNYNNLFSRTRSIKTLRESSFVSNAFPWTTSAQQNRSIADRTCSPTTLPFALLRFFFQHITFNPMGAPVRIFLIYYIPGTSVNKSVPNVFLGKVCGHLKGKKVSRLYKYFCTISTFSNFNNKK